MDLSNYSARNMINLTVKNEVITMVESILWCIGVSVVLVVCVGIPYIRGVSRHPNYRANNKHNYVIANLDKFKVKDVGSSADSQEIYLVSHERMGFH